MKTVFAMIIVVGSLFQINSDLNALASANQPNQLHSCVGTDCAPKLVYAKQ